MKSSSGSGSISERMFKAQVQTITIIIIAGIGISLAATAYTWGMPLIQKRSTINDYTVALNFIKSLDSKITSVANSMGGEETINIPSGIVSVIGWDEDDPDSNSIILEMNVPQPMMVDGNVYLETDILGEVATYGEAEPRTILLEGEKLGTANNILRLKLHYRELDTDTEPKRGYKIRLNDFISTGSNSVTIRFDNSPPNDANPERIPGGAANTGELVVTYIDISVN